MTGTEAPRSTGEMMSDILGNVGNLVRNEADLARAEFAEDVRKALRSLGAMGVGLALAVAGLNVLAAPLVMFLVEAGLQPIWARTAVGLGLLLIAVVVFSSARSTLQQIGFVPSRAARNIQRDAAVIKDSFNDK
jgi:hypothetical protein